MRRIANVGTFEVSQIKVSNGEIQIHMPLDETENSTEAIMKKCLHTFMQRNPKINRNEIMWDMRLVFSFGNGNPIFTIGVYMWAKDNEYGTMEFYDGFNITIRQDDAQYIKHLLWQRIGELVLGI